MVEPAVITIDVNPMLELGPLALAWHGIGIAAGAWLGARYARERGLDPEVGSTPCS